MFLSINLVKTKTDSSIAIIRAAEDFGCDEIDTIAKIIENYIEELGLSDYDKLSGFRWRIDVSMRYDNES